MSECSRIVINNKDHPIDVKIDWAYYRHFYGDKDGYKKGSSERASKDYTRNSFFKSDSRLKCKKYKLSIISSLFDYLRFVDFEKQKRSNKIAFEGRIPGSSSSTENVVDPYQMPNATNLYENDDNPYENDDDEDDEENEPTYASLNVANNPQKTSIYQTLRRRPSTGGRKSQTRRRSKVIKRLHNRKTFRQSKVLKRLRHRKTCKRKHL